MDRLETLLRAIVENGGSDLHLSAGSPPRIRVDGELTPLDLDDLTPENTKTLVYSVLKTDQVARLERTHELDFSFSVKGLGRFRANAFFQRDAVCGAFRLIPMDVWPLNRLSIRQELLERICAEPRGLVLVTGPTGCGKSTTLASLIGHINQTRHAHIVTIEDPIEFVHRHRECLVNQREVGTDTDSFPQALRAVLREDPDVILVGEMRDLETVQAALTLAETGHLTFATLHTNDAVQTINRIVDVFPAHQQPQVRTQLSFTLTAVFSQALVPRKGRGGRVLACEILIPNSAVRSLIRDNKAHQIYSIMQTGAHAGMQTLNQSLYQLCSAGEIAYDAAAAASSNIEDFDRMFRAEAPGRRSGDAAGRAE